VSSLKLNPTPFEQKSKNKISNFYDLVLTLGIYLQTVNREKMQTKNQLCHDDIGAERSWVQNITKGPAIPQ
jgi:hypothetical protein